MNRPEHEMDLLVAFERGRRAAFEQAAKVADDNEDGPPWLIAKVIRALIAEDGK